MAGLLRLMRRKWNPPADPTTSFAGKTIIVTGSNVGLGFEAAVKFVVLGASKVILGVRSLDKGNRAENQIEARTHRTGCVEVWQLDMNSYDSIKAFAARASTTLDHLDIVVLNAGVMMPYFEQSPHGWEETLQINVLSTTLLGLLLLPKLRSSKMATNTPVLEIVSSGTHTGAKITPEHREAENLLRSYNTDKDFNGRAQYALSKLFAMYAMLSLAALTQSSNGELDVIVTSVCPGACRSDLGRSYGWVFRMFLPILYALFFRTTEEGSRTLVSGTTLGPKGHGKFWQHDDIQPVSPLLTGEEGEKLRKQVWHEILDALRRDVPEVMELADIKSYRQKRQK